MPNPIIPIKSTTQNFVEIEDIRDDLVLLVNGSCALVIETTAVNFGLLSEKEQEALIFAYSGLLNSLSFPIQIFLHSKQKDVSAYLNLLKEAEKKQTNPVLAKRILEYRQFITATVKEKNVLDKKFYIVIPFSNLELGATNVSAFVKKSGLPYPKEQILARAKTVLTPKRDHILRQLNRLGLKGGQLSTQKLIALFYEVYNEEAEIKPEDVQGNTVPLVNKKPW